MENLKLNPYNKLTPFEQIKYNIHNFRQLTQEQLTYIETLPPEKKDEIIKLYNYIMIYLTDYIVMA